MAKLVWDKTGERLYETGVSKGVLYPVDEGGTYPTGVAWNGLTEVTESPSGAEATAVWADNIKYLNLISAEEFGATIGAYMYPPEFAECNGEAELVKGVTVGQQTRKMFGMSYQTILGNDTEGEKHGYKIHLIYGAVAAPSERAYSTVSDSPEAMQLSWEITTTPVSVTGMKPTAYLCIDSTTTDEAKLAEFEKILYGDGSGDGPRLPLPDEVKTLLTAGG